MTTVQMTIDEHLLSDVDLAVKEIGTSRSAFIRDALQAALNQLTIRKLEAQHAAGYARKPSTVDEFAEWDAVQEWENL